MGLLGYRRLPGGHYRIPEEALAEFWHVNEQRATLPPRPAPSGGGRDRARQPRGRKRSSRRRAALGEQESPPSYDLSMEALSALRTHRS
jgi:hypothetical protein